MGKLTAAVCECGQVLLPPIERCITCSSPTRSLEINDKGKILTYTVLQVPPEGYNSPLILGLIQLEEERGRDGENGEEKEVEGDGEVEVKWGMVRERWEEREGEGNREVEVEGEKEREEQRVGSNRKSRLIYPKLVCVGKLSEAELEMDQRVRVKNIGDKYYFSLLGK